MSTMRIGLWVLLFGVLALTLALASESRAHDGYETECCDNRHCRPIPPLERRGAAWVLPDGRSFPAGSTRASSSIGKLGFHLCEWLPGEKPLHGYEPSRIVQKIGTPVCLYVPDAEH